MRFERREKILELIKTQDVDTQEKLAELLNKEGFKVTQATVSRDIRELQLVKTTKKNGKNCYALPESINREEERFDLIFKHTVQDIKTSGNMIILRTLSGCANAAAEAVDTSDIPQVLGTIAGDNTVFIVVDEPASVDIVVKRCRDAFDK